MAYNTPASAARNGLSGNLDATNYASQVNQFLGTPQIKFVYRGVPILTPNGSTFTWATSAATYDYDQPFMLSGTSVGRVFVPVLVNGAGADLLVSLCPDSAGSPDLTNVLAQTLVPASWITDLSLDGPLESSSFANLQYTGSTSTPWLIPAGSPTSNSTVPTVVTSDFFTILLGGDDNNVDAAVNTVAVCSFDGASFGLPLAGPGLPRGVVSGGAMVTADTLVYVGGASKLDSSGTAYSSVYCASWNPDTGAVGAWSTQTSLPQTVVAPATASSGETVYVIGGFTDNTSSTALSTVYSNTVANGAIQAGWQQVSSLPVARGNMFAGVLNGWLVVTGGINASVTVSGATYYAKINTDGSLGSWHAGPTLPVPVYGSNYQLVTVGDNLCVVSGIDGSSTQQSTIQVLPVLADTGPAAAWRLINDPRLANTYFASGFTLDDQGDGDLVVTDIVNNAVYVYSMTPVSLISVPLPASGLTSGATYHVTLHQRPTGNPLNDYLQFGAGVGGLASTFKYRAVGSAGAWTADPSRSILIQVFDQTAGNLPLRQQLSARHGGGQPLRGQWHRRLVHPAVHDSGPAGPGRHRASRGVEAHQRPPPRQHVLRLGVHSRRPG
ncbi:hypothetical protein [Streptomyces sp. B1-3]|uniref:hypothetical protein n=1 Tax=Streptomyces sp. B1-3 TaxID=3141453 RepID=UPI003D273C8E